MSLHLAMPQPWLRPLRYTLFKLGAAWAHAH